MWFGRQRLQWQVADTVNAWIMGHEAVRKVVAVGERVPEERIGETVVVEPNLACFRCEQCQRGFTRRVKTGFR